MYISSQLQLLATCATLASHSALSAAAASDATDLQPNQPPADLSPRESRYKVAAKPEPYKPPNPAPRSLEEFRGGAQVLFPARTTPFTTTTTTSSSSRTSSSRSDKTDWKRQKLGDQQKQSYGKKKKKERRLRKVKKRRRRKKKDRDVDERDTAGCNETMYVILGFSSEIISILRVVASRYRYSKLHALEYIMELEV